MKHEQHNSLGLELCSTHFYKQTRIYFFSLIELLIVIAIIAILTSILIPALNHAREKGRESACANNLKQIGFAIYLYCGDYNDHLPAPIASSGGVAPFYIDVLKENNYLKITGEKGIAFCPVAISLSSSSGSASPLRGWAKGSYGMNYFLFSKTGHNQKTGRLVEPHRKNPSNFIMLADSKAASVATFNNLSFRHSNLTASVVLAVDGHITRLSTSRISTYASGNIKQLRDGLDAE